MQTIILVGVWDLQIKIRKMNAASIIQCQAELEMCKMLNDALDEDEKKLAKGSTYEPI